jgi:hypothetical protein
MQGIQPQSLTDKELLSASLLMFDPDTGAPVAFQKELIRRLASYVEDAQLRATDYGTALARKTDYKTSHPKQLPLFD